MQTTDNTLIIAAACLGRSNMGLGLPDVSLIHHLPSWPKLDLINAVEAVSGGYFEGDNDTFFYEEAEGWEKSLTKMGLAKAASIWPDVFILIAEAEGEDLSQLHEAAA